MLIYLISCMVISLFTLQYYAHTGFHSFSHRLLPLTLGMVCLYNFYMTIDYIAGYPDVILVLKRLLMMQILYLIFYYEIDFMHLKIKPVSKVITFLLLIGADVVVFIMYSRGIDYLKVTTVFILMCIFEITLEAVLGYRNKKFTTIEYKTYGILYISIIVPSLAMLIVMITGIRDVSILPAAFAISCALICYLLYTNNLEEPRYKLEADYFMNSDIASSIYDAEFNFLEANAKAWNTFPDLMMEMKQNSLKEWLRKHTEDDEREYDGRYYRIHVAPVVHNGVTKGYILTSMDITEEKLETHHMESLKIAAENEVKLKSAFLASMSHDLRSPLHAIIGGSDILLGRNDMFTKNRNIVYQIREAGRNLLAIVNDILDYSKLEGGRLELEHNEFEMEGLFVNQAHSSIILLKDRPIKFSLSIPDQHPKLLVGDEMRLREIVQNILSNAIKFTKEGRVDITVKCNYLTEDKVRLTIVVKDTGIGLSEEQIGKIFDEYISYSAGSTQEGTGLGLTIVKQLCEKMGGNIAAESDGVSGTTMTATVYLDCVPNLIREPIEINSESATAVVENIKIVKPTWVYPKARVLLADDMNVNLKLFKDMSNPWQFALDTASDGTEAVEMVKKEKYDLIILDQMMPVMTGEAAADEITKLCDTPIIMITADITDERKQACKKHGFAGYLPKPIELEKLKGVLEKYLPEEKRQNAPITQLDIAPKLDNREQLEAYYTSLKSYQKEVSSIRENLEEYYRNDFDKFRIKVHGIKGISKQLGKTRIGTHAEIVEMAAKCENKQFIENHMSDFLDDIDVTLEMTAKELVIIKEKLDTAKESVFRIKMGESYVNALFEKIKEGFIQYDVTKIEDALNELKECQLEEEQFELVKKIQDAFDEFEYEKGVALFEEMEN